MVLDTLGKCHWTPLVLSKYEMKRTQLRMCKNGLLSQDQTGYVTGFLVKGSALEFV